MDKPRIKEYLSLNVFGRGPEWNIARFGAFAFIDDAAERDVVLYLDYIADLTPERQKDIEQLKRK